LINKRGFLSKREIEREKQAIRLYLSEAGNAC